MDNPFKKPTVELPDETRLKFGVKPKLKKKKLDKLKVSIELSTPLPDGVDMQLYVNGNVLQLTEQEDFKAGFSFTKTF